VIFLLTYANQTGVGNIKCDYPLSISYITQKGAITTMETNRSARLHDQIVDELAKMSLIYPTAPQARLLATDDQSGSGSGTGTGSMGTETGMTGESGSMASSGGETGGDESGGSGSGSALIGDAGSGTTTGDDQSA